MSKLIPKDHGFEGVVDEIVSVAVPRIHEQCLLTDVETSRGAD